MPNNYLYEQGEPFILGAHGETDYVFASGTPVPNTGQSELVKESGIGLGGASIRIGDTRTGAFETAESHASFYDYTGATSPNAQGLLDFGIADISSDATYVFVHHDTVNDTYAAGFWHYHAGGNDIRQDATITWQGSAGNANDSAEVFDDPPDVGDNDTLTTAGDGDIVTKNEWSVTTGDGGMFQLYSGSYEITLEMSDFPGAQNGGTEGTDVWRIRGPRGNETVAGGWGSSVTIDVTIP